MTKSELPSGYRAIQDGVRKAIIDAGGRDALCEKLEIAPGTLTWYARITPQRRAKKTRLRAEVVAKLAVAAGASPDAWCHTLDLDPREHMSAIVGAQRRFGRLGRRESIAARVERLLKQRAQGLKVEQPLFRVGALRWEPLGTAPLSMPDDSIGEDITGESSFFGRYASTLLATVYPELRAGDIEYRTVDTIDELLNGLLSPTQSKSFDLVLGLFSVVSRRRQGLLFSDIPGFRLALGALSFYGRDLPAFCRPTWASILNQGRHRGAEERVCPKGLPDFDVATVKREIGWLFLRGPARFPAACTREADTLHLPGLIEWLTAQVPKQPVDRPFVLVTDEETCRRIMAWLNRVSMPERALAQRSEPNSLRTAQSDDDAERAHRVQHELNKIKCKASIEQVLKLAAQPRELIDDPDEDRPFYNLTICLPPDQLDLRTLLSQGKKEEMFGNAVRSTATLYAQACAAAILTSDADIASLTGAQSVHPGPAMIPGTWTLLQATDWDMDLPANKRFARVFATALDAALRASFRSKAPAGMENVPLEERDRRARTLARLATPLCFRRALNRDTPTWEAIDARLRHQ